MNHFFLPAIVACTALAGCSVFQHTPAEPLPSGHPIASYAKHPDAPKGVMQFGQLVGQWTCSGENLQRDGTWKPNPQPSRWDWHWILDGQAVQDIWHGQPQPSPAVLGTNIRMYDAEADDWKIAWSTTAQVRWDLVSAKWQPAADAETSGRMVMYFSKPAGPVFGARESRITFYNITGGQFDWQYEFAPPGTEPTATAGWILASKLACDKQ